MPLLFCPHTLSLPFLRLLFLLQCLLSYLASRRGRSGRRAPPLSTGTVCRKLAALLLEEDWADQDHRVKAALHEAPSNSTVQLLESVSTRATGTQTTETCLSLCAYCLEHRETLTAAAQVVAGALETCQQSKGESPVAEAGRTCVDADKGAAEWLRVFEDNVSHIVAAHKCMLDRCASLASRLQSAEQQLQQGEDALSAAQQELDRAVENSEAASQERLTELEERYSQEMKAREREVACLEQTKVDLEGWAVELQQRMLNAETTAAEQSGCLDSLISVCIGVLWCSYVYTCVSAHWLQVRR